MKINNALKILQLNYKYNKENILDLSILDLKKQYHILAKCHHPDKNNCSDESNKIFKEINTAYIYLSQILNNKDKIEEKDDNDELYNLINAFMDIIQSNNLGAIPEFKETCYNYIAKILKEFLSLDKYNPSILEDIYNILNTKYFNIPKDILDILNKTIEEALQNYNIYLINAEFEKIYNNEIYILDISGDKIYVPLWHSELQYNNILIKINPIIDNNIIIDNDNNIHIYYEENLETIVEMLRQNNYILSVKIDNISIDLSLSDLHITKSQIYKILNKGLSIINSTNIFDNTKKGDIYLHITFK